MKKIMVGLLCEIFLLTACGQTSSATQAAPIPVVHTSTSTSSPIPTTTATSLPTETQTPSITPLPTIPTFTPTFDASTIVTVTPAAKAQCPSNNSSVTANISAPKDDPYDYKDFLDSVLEFLNSGGSIETLKSVLGTKNQQAVIYGSIMEQNLTNDGSSAIILKSHGSVFILHCREHKYEIIFTDFPELGASFSDVEIIILDDLNQNSVPEILVSKNTCSDMLCNEVKVLEWNASGFRSLLKRVIDREGNTVDDTFADEIRVTDFDGNGIQDIVGKNNVPRNPDPFLACIPCRSWSTAYSWGGNYFVEGRLFYSSAAYRFQAIQDADQYTNNGEYEKALSLHQDAIFSDKLDWWSKERQVYLAKIFSQGPEPISDSTEYPRLAAYAYYRIMLLHVVQGHESDAGTVYKTLEQKFGNDQYGQPYVEMATAFWDAYQSTHKMYNGCAAAIEYAAEHPEILTPLGSDYHGSQSHTYVPADVCPFR